HRPGDRQRPASDPRLAGPRHGRHGRPRRDRPGAAGARRGTAAARPHPMSAEALSAFRPGANRAVGGTVLIVEDEHSIGALIRSYLSRDGYGVVWVRSGEEALVELVRHSVRIVVLDIGLPGMDGFEVCRQIRSRSSVPILIVTARDEEPDRVAGL